MKLALLFVTMGCAAAQLPSPAGVDQRVLSVGQGPGSIAIADVNHDGRPDLLVADITGQTLTVLLGDGHGQFSPAPRPAPAIGPAANDVATGDFNHDGNLDVAIPNTGTPFITILLGDGRGGFTPSAHSPFSTTSYPHVHGVAAADFNSDGKLDLVTDSWGHDQILMLLGDGAGNLALPGRSFDTGKRPYERLRSADLNKDGRADVVTTDMDINAVSILLGDGKGGLSNAPGSPTPAGAAPWAVTIDDMNGDGNPDLVVIPYDRDVTEPKQLGVTVLLGDGRGGFSAMRGSPFSLAGCAGPDRVATGDLDANGVRDIVVSCAQNDRVMVYLGSRGGMFERSVREVVTGWSGLAVGDLNGDGKADIVVSNFGPENAPTPTRGTVTIFFSR